MLEKKLGKVFSKSSISMILIFFQKQPIDFFYLQRILKISLKIRFFGNILTYLITKAKSMLLTKIGITHNFQNWMDICVTNCTLTQKLVSEVQKSGQRLWRRALRSWRKMSKTHRACRILQHIAKWLPQIAKWLPQIAKWLPGGANQRNHPREQPAELHIHGDPESRNGWPWSHFWPHCANYSYDLYKQGSKEQGVHSGA